MRKVGGNTIGRRALKGINHQEQLHQIIVARSTDGLDDKDIAPTDVLRDLNRDFTITKRTDISRTE